MPDAVTGAFSFTGRAIAGQLLATGREVVTLVRRPAPADADPRIRPVQLTWDDPVALARGLEGVEVLYNTYWIRFPRGELTYHVAVERNLALVEAARRAGVRRLVHVSVVNATRPDGTAYFAAKAQLEKAIRASGLSHAIVRPTLTFGLGDILVNNLCWVLRRFPAFAVPGDGRYRLQPVHVEDVARICLGAGEEREDVVVDAAGPEVLTFDEFVRGLAEAVGSRAWLFHAPRGVAYAASSALGWLVRDVMLTADEVTELTGSYLVSVDPPTGTTSLLPWVREHADQIGRRYHSELDRHYR